MERRLAHRLVDARRASNKLDRRGRMRAVVHAFFDAIRREPRLYEFLIHTGGDTPHQPGALSWFTRLWAASVAEHLSVTRGEADVSTNSQAMGVAMCGALQAAGSWWLEEPSASMDAVVDALTDMLLSGLPAETVWRDPFQRGTSA